MQLSIVIPVYNEAEVLPQMLSTLGHVMSTTAISYELIIVDDGSSDGTASILNAAAAQDKRLKVLSFSRNFGHQAAITAGLDHASGDAVVVMDADLQDPPELLPEMLSLLSRGYDVVSGQRHTREGETTFKRMTATMFYWVFRRLVDERLQPEVGDFRMFSRRAIVAIRHLREQHRFMRGMVAWLGLREVILPYHRNPRGAGTTKYSTWKMMRFAWTAISSFSALPLRLSVIAGLLITALGVGVAIYVVYADFVLKATVPGWTSLVCLNITFSGATLVAIGLLGEYVARIYEESKGRPLYVISSTANCQAESQTNRGVVLPPPAESQSVNHEAPRTS
jgi:dolichol-phosphate mannosyltransferase